MRRPSQRRVMWVSGIAWIVSWSCLGLEIFHWHHVTKTLHLNPPKVPPGYPEPRPWHSRLNRITRGAPGVAPARRGCPLMPSRFGLADVPAFGLFDLVAGTAAGARVAGARSSAFVVWRRMLKIGFPRVPGTDRESACAVADLDQMAESVIRLIGVRFVPGVPIERRD